MSEGGSEYVKGATVVQVDNVSRLPRPEGGLPPLMDDVRATHLAAAELPESHGKVFLKAVGAPYTGEHGVHLLAIPDAPDARDLPGVKDLSAKDLGATIQFASAFAEKTLARPEIDEVDLGWHHSRAELAGIPKQRQATFPRNMHVHVLGFSRKDMQHVETGDALSDPELKGKMGDEQTFHAFGEELFAHEIIAPLRDENPAFEQIFEESKDQRGRLAFKMRAGKDGFAHPELPGILQKIDARAKEEYDKVGACFFLTSEKGEFKVKEKTEDNPYERFELLPVERRQEKIQAYLQEHPWLSEKVQFGLKYLASNAQDETVLIGRELEKARNAKGEDLSPDETKAVTAQAANRFWAYKDLVYSMVWSAKKGQDGKEPEWVFRFDPSIFTVDGIVKTSPHSAKIITKGTEHYTDEQLVRVQEKEREIISAVQSEHPTYRTGPGITLHA